MAMSDKNNKIKLILDELLQRKKLSLGIVGSRNIEIDIPLMEDILRGLNIENSNIGFIVSGAGGNVDKTAEAYADSLNIEKKIFPANWSKYGKRAGAIRNQDIVKNSDLILAIWNGQSKGTKITIDIAIKEETPVIVCSPPEFNYELL